MPVLLFIVLGAHARPRTRPRPRAPARPGRVNLPVFAAVLIALSAVLSLVTIISIYREGGILKRLRATPLRPQTILSAHVLVKLLLTAVTLVLMCWRADATTRLTSTCRWSASRWPAHQHAEHPVARLPDREHRADGAFRAADRRGHPVSDDRRVGLFVPVASLPPLLRGVARVLPLTYAVSLLQGIWKGEAWSAHIGDVAALAVAFAVCTAISAKVFRWE